MGKEGTLRQNVRPHFFPFSNDDGRPVGPSLDITSRRGPPDIGQTQQNQQALNSLKETFQVSFNEQVCRGQVFVQLALESKGT